MVYEETSGLYYDYKTGYYFDAERSLYYDGHSGTYYSYNYDTQSYEVHSQLEPGPKQAKAKKRKKKEKEAKGNLYCRSLVHRSSEDVEFCNGRAHFKNVNNCLNTNIFYLETDIWWSKL
jgi:hypothetical protein